jgi:hypothetical protein
MAKEKYEYKVMKSRGARLQLIKMPGSTVWKFHSETGPAVKPFRKDSTMEKGYFLYGEPYSQLDFEELMKEKEGTPWYKAGNVVGTARF